MRDVKILCRNHREIEMVLNYLDDTDVLWNSGDKPSEIFDFIKRIHSRLVLIIKKNRMTYDSEPIWETSDIIALDFLKQNGVEINSICEHCGEVIEDIADVEYHDGKWYCKDCLDEFTFICDNCGKRHDINDMNKFKNKYYCDICLNALTFICDECGEREYRSNGHSDDSIMICENCYINYYERCYECDELVRNNNVYEYNCHYYCEHCYNDITRGIHDYHYKPEPIFYSTGGNDSQLFYGVELEVDGAGEYSDKAGRLYDVDGEDRIYCKHDGSLDRGFEIVSHPMTYEYHKNKMCWNDIMCECLDMDYRSHNAETCGLHIHVGRNSLGNNLDEREETISKIVYFVENHWDKFVTFSRRTIYQLDRWCSPFGKELNADETYKKAKGKGNRYVAINLQNSSTIEFRFFRGTLRYTTFIATLQMVNKICNMCITKDVKTIESMTWDDFVKSIKEPELIEYLKTKNLYI